MRQLITPEMAAIYLKRNSVNRPVSQRLITEYSRMMAAGLWFEDTGETLKFTPDGVLIDGQHRLYSLIKANVRLIMDIVEVPIEAFRYIDQGKKRGAGDVFACNGILNYRGVSSGLRRYLALKKGWVIGSEAGGLNTLQLAVSGSELLSVYECNPKIYQGAFNNSQRWYHKSGRLMKMAEIMGYYLYFRDIHEDDAFEFMKKLFEGIEMEPNSPIVLLKRRLMENNVNTRYKISGKVKTALTIKTWNYYRKNEHPLLLSFNINRDNFPTAI